MRRGKAAARALGVGAAPLHGRLGTAAGLLQDHIPANGSCYTITPCGAMNTCHLILWCHEMFDGMTDNEADTVKQVLSPRDLASVFMESPGLSPYSM